MFYGYRGGSGCCCVGTDGVKVALRVQRREWKVFYGYRGGSDRCSMSTEEGMKGFLWLQRRE